MSRASLRFGAVLLLALCLGPREVLGAAQGEDGIYLAVGGHFAHIYEHPESGPGFYLACVFPPAAVGQFSEALAKRGLGFALAYQRSVMEGEAVVEGVELTLRRHLDLGPDNLTPFLGFGLGQSAVKPEGGDPRSTWSAVLGVGAELNLSDRFLVQLEVLTRSIEFSNDSYTMTALTLTFGTRFDA